MDLDENTQMMSEDTLAYLTLKQCNLSRSCCVVNRYPNYTKVGSEQALRVSDLQRKEKIKNLKYPHVPSIPFRSIIVASSTGGKSVLIQNLILNVYKHCFSRVFIFSPSVHNDPTLLEFKKYQREEMKVDDTKEQVDFDDYHPEDLENIFDTQRKVTHYMKILKRRNCVQC